MTDRCECCQLAIRPDGEPWDEGTHCPRTLPFTAGVHGYTDTTILERDCLRLGHERLRSALDDFEVRFEVERQEHDVTKGYRQHAEQERDSLRSDVERLTKETWELGSRKEDELNLAWSQGAKVAFGENDLTLEQVLERNPYMSPRPLSLLDEVIGSLDGPDSAPSTRLLPDELFAAISSTNTVSDGFPPFGCDPEDSARLLELRQAIDDHLPWESNAAREAGDYVGAVRFAGELARAALKGHEVRVHGQFEVGHRVRLVSAESETTQSALLDASGRGLVLGGEYTVENLDGDCVGLRCTVGIVWLVATRDLRHVIGAVEPRPLIRWFAEQMELKLRENDHKGGWHEDEPMALLKRVRQETKELSDAIENCGPPNCGCREAGCQHTSFFTQTTAEDVVREAADVANMAMMVADHFRSGGPSREQGKDEAPTRDACQRCKGARGGVPGNENIVNGEVVCDYCHAEMRR